MVYNKVILFLLLLCYGIEPIRAETLSTAAAQAIVSQFQSISWQDQGKALVKEFCLHAGTHFTTVLVDFNRHCALFSQRSEDLSVQANSSQGASDSNIKFAGKYTYSLPDDKNQLLPAQKKHHQLQYSRYRKVQSAIGLASLLSAYTDDDSMIGAGIHFATRLVDQDIDDTGFLGEPELLVSKDLTLIDRSYNQMQHIRKFVYDHKKIVGGLTWATRIGSRAFDKAICQKLWSRTCTCADCVKLLTGIVVSLGKESAGNCIKQYAVAPAIGWWSDRPDYNASTYRYAESTLPGAVGASKSGHSNCGGC